MPTQSLSAVLPEYMNAHGHAANYIWVGRIYLYDVYEA
jgi:hypothetical protein